jgi:hypothetical protein
LSARSRTWSRSMSPRSCEHPEPQTRSAAAAPSREGPGGRSRGEEACQGCRPTSPVNRAPLPDGRRLGRGLQGGHRADIERRATRSRRHREKPQWNVRSHRLSRERRRYAHVSGLRLHPRKRKLPERRRRGGGTPAPSREREAAYKALPAPSIPTLGSAAADTALPPSRQQEQADETEGTREPRSTTLG